MTSVCTLLFDDVYVHITVSDLLSVANRILANASLMFSPITDKCSVKNHKQSPNKVIEPDPKSIHPFIFMLDRKRNLGQSRLTWGEEAGCTLNRLLANQR